MEKNKSLIPLLYLCLILMTVLSLQNYANAAAEEIKKFDLIVRTEITINASASEIWPLLFNPKEWKSSVGKLERVTGEPNKEGETLRMTPKGGGEDQGYYIQYVRMVENRQLVIKIFNIPDDGFVGYSDFSLFESNGKTHMIYDVYVEYSLPGMSDEEVKTFGQQVYEETKKKLESENRKLKDLIETQNSQSS